MQSVLKTVCASAATMLIVAGCTDYESATSLNPDGPPMVRQVRMKESYLVPGAPGQPGTLSERRVFGFGTHPDAIEAEEHAVTSARVKGQGFRVIMDELLIGNNLEEISCRANVDGDAYSRVPLGATPDDIAKCSTAQDVLPSTCKGPLATCLCDLDAGCTVTTPMGTQMIAKGAPVGVDDKNQDGSADDTRLINGSVGFKCGAITVPIDLDMSYWNPSGNQQPPAMGGFDALGPAIVLIPQRGMPSNIDCQLAFAPDVVDKQNIQVCAPPNGDVLSDCAPGDTAQVHFKTEPMVFNPPFDPNATGINKTDAMVFTGITPLDPSSTAGVTMMQGSNPYNNFTVAINMTQNLLITPGGAGFAANTTYTITLTTAIKDTFMQSLPAAQSITFTTGP
jgi:hypothetical protein